MLFDSAGIVGGGCVFFVKTRSKLLVSSNGRLPGVAFDLHASLSPLVGPCYAVVPLACGV